MCSLLKFKKFAWVVCVLAAAAALGKERVPEPGIPVETCEAMVRTVVRVHTQAAKGEKISNPVWYQPLLKIVQDGASVKKGDVVAVFESKELEYDLQQLILQRDLTRSYLDMRLKEIDDGNQDRLEREGLMRDKLATLESKLHRQLSEPTDDDIRIVQGRLRIATMNREAADKEYRKAQDRFARNMISRAEMENYYAAFQETEVKETFAKRELQLTLKNPLKELDLQITRLEIQLAKMELANFQVEMEEQSQVSALQRKSTDVKAELRERQIKEKQQALERVVVKAPIDGIISMNRYNGNDVVPGTRMWLNYVFMEIPDLKTICFKGTLPENRRPMHKEGDAVTIRMNGWRDTPLQGRLKSISTLSHDLSEKEDAGWDREKSYGTKVFDVEIELTAPSEWLRPGMFGEAEIQAGELYRGPAVPLHLVRRKNGHYYLSFDGIYREVQGTPIGKLFFLSDAQLLDKLVGRSGIFPEEADYAKSVYLTATGELSPVKSTTIHVGDVGWWPWPKITWLKEEESMVKKGEVIARLDPDDRVKSVRNQEAEVLERKAALEEQERDVQITKRNYDFAVRRRELELEIVKLQTKRVLDVLDELAIAEAEKNLRLAEIHEKQQSEKLAREEARERPTVSPAEMRKYRRQLQRYRLQVEQAKLRLQTARAGATELERIAALMNLRTSEDALVSVQGDAQYSNLTQKLELHNRTRRLRATEKRLDYLRRQVKNHVITAPCDGLLCYEKVYFNGAITKVATGNTVGRRFAILSIPDLSQMEIKVELNEKYFSQVKPGMRVDVRLASLGGRTVSATVNDVDLLFQNRRKKDRQIGIYSSHEPLGEVVFVARIRLDSTNLFLKPGLAAEVIFPVLK